MTKSREMKKRVLSICYIIPNKLGSFEEFMIALSKGLKEKGFSHVVVFIGEPIKEVYDRLLETGAEIEVINPSFSYMKDAFLFYKLSKKINPSLVHFHFYECYTIFNYLTLFKNIRIIYSDRMSYKKAKSHFKEILREVYYPLRGRLFDFGINKIICVSKFVKLSHIRRYKVNQKKLITVYNGINIDKYKKINGKNNKIINKSNIICDNVITYIGALIEEKGVQYLIEAAPIIIENIPNVKFFVVGGGVYRKNLEALIKKHNLNNYFVFSGLRSDVEYFYAISSCVVIPSIWGEGFCFVAAEAMAMEVPVVAFNRGGLKEVIADGETGYLVSQKDYLALAEKIVEITRNEGIREMMGKKGRKRVIEKFSLKNCVDKHIKIYEEVL